MNLLKGKRLRIYWSIAIALIIIMIACVYFFFSFLNPELLTKRANRLFHEQEEIAMSQLQQLSSTKDFNTIHLEHEKTLYLCYLHDSILFWSNNYEPVPALFSDLDDLNQTFVTLKNGSFYPSIYEKGDSIWMALIPVYYNYPVENVYFKNRFSDVLQLPNGSAMSCSEDDYCINAKDGTFLCSILYQPKIIFDGWRYGVVFTLFLLCYLSIIFCIYQTYLIYKQRVKKKTLFFSGTIFLIFLFSALILWLRFPEVIFNHPIFSPYYFAYNRLLSSEGQTLIIALTLALVCYFIYNFIPLYRNRPVIILILYAILSGGLFFLLLKINEILIMNATVFIDLAFIFKINIYSLLHLFSIFCMSLFIFLINMMLKKVILIKTFNRLLLLLATAIVVAIAVMIISGLGLLAFVLCFVWIAVPVIILFYSKKTSLRYLFYNAIVFALLSAAILEYYVYQSEQKYRLVLAEKFAEQGRKEDREFFFQKLSDKILEDKDLQGYLKNFTENMPIEYDQVICDHIIDQYLSKVWFDYHIDINICSASDIFTIGLEKKGETCFDYFYQKIGKSGEVTLSPNLYLFSNDYYSFSYIGIIQPKKSAGNKFVPTIFVELVPLHFYTESDYPDFLDQQNTLTFVDAANYSYAIYDSSGLIYSFGDDNFPVSLAPIKEWPHETPYYFYKANNNNTLYYHIIDNKTLIINNPNKSIAQIIAPFIYLLISYLLLLYGICRFADMNLNVMAHSQLRTRLQQAILLVLSLAFITIGSTMLLFLNILNERKNEDNLQEKTKSIMATLNNPDLDIASMLKISLGSDHNTGQILKDLSSIFFSEINLYNMQGEIYATSNPSAFNNGILSSLIDYNILSNVIKKQEHTIIQQESIGKKKYLSSYSTIYDSYENPIAILNVTYFSHSGQHEHEMEAFISAFITFYILFFLLFLGILLYLSNQITQPIRFLIRHFGNIRIGRRNEKISWNNSDDEFTKMVEEYNRMIDELESSAEKLAASERESGWRDMAQQVAHEIKNPLTPMKLTVQHLQRSWNQQTQYTQEQIDRFCSTLIQQIDTLSDIANEFSYFAKTPTPNFNSVDLDKTLAAAIAIYENSNVRFHISGFENLFMDADQRLILRVFNNLIKNSVESFDKNHTGDIDISAVNTENQLIIKIKDNGHGISPEMLQRIFVPTFTTRSSGMGLGLSMVKTIVEEHNGTISVVSEKGKGTTFTMVFNITEK